MILHSDLISQDLNQRPRKLKRRKMKPTFQGIIIWHIAIFCYFMSQYLCNAISSDNVIDLSYEFDNETIYWVNTKSLFMDIKYNGTSSGKEKYWYQVEEISAGTHGGTHLDAPCHFARGRWCASDIPIDRLIVESAVVDISSYVGDDPNVHLTSEHLIEWEGKHGRIPDKSLLLVVTGWARFWPDRQTYTGTTERNASLLKFPSITAEAAQWLVDNRNIVGIGIDTMSVDMSGSDRPRTHIIMGDQNIYNLENVNDQTRLLPPTGATVYVMPMKLKGASGAPCRIFAVLSGNDTSTGSCSIFPHYILLSVVLISLFYLFRKKL